jgi:hypothetical protein
MAIAMPLIMTANALAADQSHKDCYCRANDRQYSQGEVLCLLGRLARCEMNLNNPTWKIISQTCPESRSIPSPESPKQSIIATK